MCSECKKQIIQKSDLVVAGKLMQPYHKECLAHPNSKIGKLHHFYGAYPVGMRFWLWIIGGNFALYMLFRRHADSFYFILLFGMIFNLVFVSGRVGIYLSYEKYLEE